MVEHLHTSFVLYILDSLFGGFRRPSVSDAIVPVRPELRLHLLTVITQIWKFYKRTKVIHCVPMSARRVRTWSCPKGRIPQCPNFPFLIFYLQKYNQILTKYYLLILNTCSHICFIE